MNKKITTEEFFDAADHKLIIRDIHAMYHHRWDVIGEALQNGVDSVLKKSEEGSKDYEPKIEITYNLRKMEITLKDNGEGIKPEDVKKVVAPHVSFKNPLGANRGEFGVGLTLVAFSTNDFKLETLFGDKISFLEIKNGYAWAMDEDESEKVDIAYSTETTTNEERSSFTKITAKPVRFTEYTISQLEYILRRFTALGDFWNCINKRKGVIETTLIYIDKTGKEIRKNIDNSFWHPADFFERIDVETVEWTTVRKETEKGKEQALPNWVGFALTDIDTLNQDGKEFTYYAVFSRAGYYKQLAELIGLSVPYEDESPEDESSVALPPGAEILTPGIFLSKKGMPLGAIVDPPRTAQSGYWRGLFIAMNCDNLSTEPGRKKIHADDEHIVREVARKIFYRLTRYSHYIIPRDPDEETESLLRNVDRNLEEVKKHRVDFPLNNPKNKIVISNEPINEQTLIGLFHELIGAGILKGYKALKLSATETYDGIYEYEIPFEEVGREHITEWLRGFKATERKQIEKSNTYHVPEMIVEFKMHLEDIIKDFLQKTKYHRHIKLIVVWEAEKPKIENKGWLLEEVPKNKRKFFGAYWRLRPSSEGQTLGVLATEVLLLKDFLVK